MNQLRALLNRVLWNPSEKKEKGEYRLVFRDGDTEREISLDGIAKVDGFGFTLPDGTYIPLHRVRSVRKGGEVVWRKAPVPDTSA